MSARLPDLDERVTWWLRETSTERILECVDTVLEGADPRHIRTSARAAVESFKKKDADGPCQVGYVCSGKTLAVIAAAWGMSRGADLAKPAAESIQLMRDRFAMSALNSGMIDARLSDEEVAKAAYQLADAMLAARGGK